jgi:hypothetical protein
MDTNVEMHTKGVRYTMDRFDSLWEMLDYANDNPTKGQSEHGTYENTETRDWSDAYRLGKDGWSATRPQVDEMLEALRDRIGQRLDMSTVIRWDVAGGAVDVGRWCQGLPDHMLDFPMVPTERMGKVVRLFVDYGASASYTAEFIRNRGVAILALIDTLKALGVSMEVWGETAVCGRGDTVHTTVTKLHDPANRLDIDELMFALGHPAMLRRVAFGVRERSKVSKHINAYAGGGYGRTRTMMYAQEMGADICVERLENGSSRMMSDPVEWVMQTVTGLGLVK